MRSPFGRRSVAVLVVAFLSGALHAQTTWFVDDDAPPPGLGTPGSPYSRLQYAIDRPATVTGDTILVAPGTYAEQIVLLKFIQVRATDGPRVTSLVRPSGVAGAHVLMGPFDPDIGESVRLEGFTITGTTGMLTSVNLQSGALVRCVVAGNSALAVSSIFGIVRSCTIADNGTGIFFATFGETTLADSIVWGNGADIIGVGGFGSARYTTFGTNPGSFVLTAGPGNESTDPLFVDAAGGDYRLRLASPCIDSADPWLAPDPDGTPADRGALRPLRVFQRLQR